jgi:Kef-type K+ transport system membrane component KefB
VRLALDTLFAVALVAAIAPLLIDLLPGPRLPQVVVLLAGGAVIGPQAIGVGDPASIELLSNLGLGFLFLLTGYELELRLFRERRGRLAIAGWLISVVLAGALIGLLRFEGEVQAVVPLSLALATTALGTLLPILRDHGVLDSLFGRNVIAAGAVGELFPVIAIALFLGASTEFSALLSLAGLALLGVLLSQLPRFVRGHRLGRIIAAGQHATSQILLRWTVVLLLLLLIVATDAGLDAVLGAFMAGIVLRRWAPVDAPALAEKLDALGYGFFIPIFFVSSGMTLDLRAIAAAPFRVVGFVLLLVLVRGLPSMLVYRTELPRRERVQMTLVTATSLPLLVALATIGLHNGTMRAENAAALVGAGAISVLLFPTIAMALTRRRMPPA